MKKFLIVLISGTMIVLGTLMMSMSINIDITGILGTPFDGVLTFFVRTTLGVVGAALVVLSTNTAIYQATGISLIKELEYYVIGAPKNEEVGDK